MTLFNFNKALKSRLTTRPDLDCLLVRLYKTIFKTRKPRKGAAVIAASMHGSASCRKFKWSVTLTLTLDGVKVT